MNQQIKDFFGILIITIVLVILVFGIDILFNIFIEPIKAISWNLKSRIILPLIFIMMIISLFIENNLWRRILLSLSMFIWVVFGLYTVSMLV